jgi:hypothetical protein
MPDLTRSFVRPMSAVCKNLRTRKGTCEAEGVKRRAVHDWTVHVEILAVSRNPVGRNIALRGCQIHIAEAHHPMQAIFQLECRIRE